MGLGSAVHSCTRLAAFPALLLMPLHSLVRTSNRMHFCRLQMPWEHPSSPCLPDKQGVVLHGPWGYSLVGVQGEGWQSCPLCPSSALGCCAGGLGAESGSAGAAARQRCWCQPAQPAPCPCCQAGGRPADRSEERCQTGLEAGSATRGLSWKEEMRELCIYHSKVQGYGVTG